jgi:hypothetical protein
MAKAGFALNILSVIVITLMVYFIGTLIFKLDVFPDWAL